jgi:hypothetical protein
MKADLGGKDARSIENSGTYHPDLKFANNNFKIISGLVLGFLGGRRNLLPFFCAHVAVRLGGMAPKGHRY